MIEDENEDENEKECLDILLNPSVSIEEKTLELARYIARWELVGPKAGIGICEGRRFGYNQLFEALPKSNKKAKQRLEAIIGEIFEYNEKLKRNQNEERKSIAQKLRTLNEGTCILIRNQNRKDIVRLIEVKRTSFMCEYPDGRRYIIPVENFIRVSRKSAFEPLPNEIRQLRGLIRSLAGAPSKQERAEIVKGGVKNLKILLDELAATLDRIEDAPSGISGGILGAALGPVKKVNPLDKALVKRIPEVIGQIAGKTGAQKVQKQIEKYPNAKVRKLCTRVLDKLKR